MSRSSVLTVTHVLYLSDQPGRSPFSGAELHVLELLPALVARGVHVELIVLQWGGGELRRVRPALQVLHEQGVLVQVVEQGPAASHSVLARYGVAAKSWGRLFLLLRARRQQIIHLHLDLVFAPVVAFTARCRRLVVSVHNDEPAYESPRWRLWLRVLRGMVPSFIAITDHVNLYFRAAAGLESARVRTVYYGFKPPRRDLRSRSDLGLPEDAFLLGFVGRLAPQKNLEVLLEIAHQRPSIHIALIGDGPLQEVLRRDAAQRKLSNVHFLGSMPDAAGLMPLFDVFCLPSLWEGLGVVLIEAMMQGVPILGSQRGAIPEVLQNGKFGMLFEPTADGLLRALDDIRGEPARAKATAVAAANDAVTRYSPQRMAAETVSVYQGLLSR